MKSVDRKFATDLDYVMDTWNLTYNDISEITGVNNSTIGRVRRGSYEGHPPQSLVNVMYKMITVHDILLYHQNVSYFSAIVREKMYTLGDSTILDEIKQDNFSARELASLVDAYLRDESIEKDSILLDEPNRVESPAISEQPHNLDE